MKGYIKAKESTCEHTNPTASVLKAIGWITILVGLIAGTALANQSGSRYSSFNWSTAIGVWASTAVSGTLFLGFAEVITLLQTLVDRDEYVCEFKENGLVNTTEVGTPSSLNIKSPEAVSASVPAQRSSTLPSTLTTCPSCNTVQSSDRNVCWQCGKALIKATENTDIDI